jgi:UDP-N-acetylmuramate-alanine ligase
MSEESSTIAYACGQECIYTWWESAGPECRPSPMVLLGRGFRVSGSDMVTNEQTENLGASGVTIYIGTSEQIYVEDVDLVVVSSAVPSANSEWTAARARGIPVMKRAELVGYLMQRERRHCHCRHAW